MTSIPIKLIPDSSAVRVALWRALHMQVDSKPHILQDEVGLQLAAPDSGWQLRPDMHPVGTRGYRASIVGRSRLIEDLVLEKFKQGIGQYVILGAGLDTFAQRRPAGLESLKFFEIDQPVTQEWKRNRLLELGYETSENLNFVPVNFEKGESWLQKLQDSGFNPQRPAVISSTGVSMYISKEANKATLQEMSKLASGTVLALTFILPLEMIPEEERAQHQMVYEKARQAGTPFISFFSPDEILEVARGVGFKKVEHISRDQIIQRYFLGRTDGFQPSHGEEFLIAEV